MIYLYECQECGVCEEIECKLAEKDKQSCPSCNAPPEKMKQLINANFKRHVSWSTWRNLG
jgi:putative FmdB family regulatory protein